MVSAKIRRDFLSWDAPALPEAARRLAQFYRHGQTLDLSGVIVVVPGQRAGRRLHELLAFLAEDEQLRLTPPDVVTEGRLPEMLYTPKQPFANEITQDLAWSRALREMPAAKRRHIVPHPPEAGQAVRWLELGAVIRGLHRELAADGLDFLAVHHIGPRLADFHEAERWSALALVQQRYLELLDSLQLWDIQTARLKAIEFKEVTTERDIILLGTVDLNGTLRTMLEAVAGRVTAFIAAPAALADQFDVYGCLVPHAWLAATMPLRDAHLSQVDGPLEQADAVTDWLGRLNGRFRKDEVVIGVPDESLVPQLQRQLSQAGVTARWVEGVRLGATAPYRLLEAAVRFAAGRRYEDMAALIRHPDIEAWLDPPRPPLRKGGRNTRDALFTGSAAIPSQLDIPFIAKSLPAQLDDFYNQHLPSRVHGSAALKTGWPALAAAVTHIEDWLRHASARMPLRQWGGAFRELLSAIYGTRTLDLEQDADKVLHKTLAGIVAACAQLDDLPEALDTESISAEDAFHIALAPLADTFLPPPLDADAVEILGWLELPLDDAPALAIASFNEGFVPQSAGADAFLPDRLRRELGLLHNERRYARDAYATSVLCHSRAELLVLLGRRNSANDPLQPSRLLFACPDDLMIQRAKKFFGDIKAPAVQRRLLLAPNGPMVETSCFVRPPAVPLGKKRDRISVSTFKHYLACPYRFYLRQVRDLKAIEDSGRELEASHFGALLHRVLSAFGRDGNGARTSQRAEDVFADVHDRITMLAKTMYGGDMRRPALRLQMEQARQRLKWFAACQAELARDGWRILCAENDDEKKNLEIGFGPVDEPIILLGRIDRIDFNESTNTLRILDYKTGDKGQAPEATHRDKDTWIDLQLPLYRHLSKALRLGVPEDCQVQLAYFNLPKQAKDTGVKVAEWTHELLADADATACQVIRGLRAEVYEPMKIPAPAYCEDLAGICVDDLREPPPITEGETGDEA